SDFAPNLLKSDKRELQKNGRTITELYIESIVPHCVEVNSGWAGRCMLKLAKAWIAQPNVLSEKTAEACRKILKPFQPDINKHLVQLGLLQDEAVAVAAPTEKFNEFPGQECRLSELRKRADELAAENYKQAEALCKEIKRRDKNDPAHYRQTSKVAQKFPASSNPPFDKNYLGKGIAKDGEPPFFFDASHLQNPVQSAILSALPHTAKTAGKYFEAAICAGTKVFVSLHEIGEIKERCEEFWRNSALSQFTFRDGTTIVNTTDANPEVVMTGNSGSKIPLLVAVSRLAVSNGSTVFHIHCSGWPDSKPLPDEAVMHSLFDHIEKLSPESNIPIAINCKGGVGRTGTTYLCYYLRKLIQARLRAGEKLDDITINIPQSWYEMRGERSGLISHGEQIAQVYSVTAAYYESLKAQQAHPLPQHQKVVRRRRKEVDFLGPILVGSPLMKKQLRSRIV
ncbi:MAG TPA: protein-tyrosine phosphatase family protein, partial [Chlamydiales bacterium]|nr:protein-tyrosine phosphatase family protein [Chlamydiales bacterium]